MGFKLVQAGSSSSASYLPDITTGLHTDKSGSANTAAIHDAIAKQGSGAKIILPPDDIEIDDIVLDRNPTISIEGVSAERSRLHYLGSGKVISIDASQVGSVDQIHWGNFTIDCTASTATEGIHFTDNPNGNGNRWGSLYNILIKGHNTAGTRGLRGTAFMTSTLSNIISEGWGECFYFETGVTAGRRSSANTFLSCLGKNPVDTGWYIGPECRHFRLQMCRVESDVNTPDYGFHLDCGSVEVGHTHALIDCETEDDYAIASYLIEDAKDIRVIGGGAGTSATGEGYKLMNVTHSEIKVNCRPQGTHHLTLDANCTLNDVTVKAVKPSDTPSVVDLGSSNTVVIYSDTTKV